MEPAVCFMEAATPALPLPPWPVGHCTDLPAPTFGAQWGLWPLSHVVKMEVGPEPSARWTTWIAVDGSVTPGLSAAMAGSFHFVIVPRNIFAIVAPSRLSGFVTSGRLYETTTAPRQVGSWMNGAETLAGSEASSDTSVTPKSTVLEMNCCTPPPEPIAW